MRTVITLILAASLAACGGQAPAPTFEQPNLAKAVLVIAQDGDVLRVDSLTVGDEVFPGADSGPRADAVKTLTAARESDERLHVVATKTITNKASGKQTVSVQSWIFTPYMAERTISVNGMASAGREHPHEIQGGDLRALLKACASARAKDQPPTDSVPAEAPDHEAPEAEAPDHEAPEAEAPEDEAPRAPAGD